MASSVDLSHIPRAREIPRVSGRLELNASISEMGISAENAKKLTPAAAKLTKADLIALNTPNQADLLAKLHLKHEDLLSIQEAFAGPLYIGGVGKLKIHVSCCCCTPCCCAAAAIEPMHSVA